MSRVWELFAGSICAVVLRSAPPRPQGLLAAAGLGAILVAIFAFDGTTPFPSLYALLPVGGTALIILFSSGTTVARLLSWRVLVGVGLISYSAYLWHQPLFAFARIRSVHEPSLVLMTGLGLLALVLAWATWAFVESPFRGRVGAARFSRGRIFAMAGAGGALFLAFGVLLDWGEGLDWRRAPSGLVYADYDFDHVLRINYGLDETCKGFTELASCRTSDRPKVLLWGDSYAMHLAPALLGSKPDLALVQQTMSACMPIKGVSLVDARHPFSWAKRCLAYNDEVLEWLSEQPTIDYVVISSVMIILTADLTTAAGNVTPNNIIDFLVQRMKETTNEITAMGKRPVMVSPPPISGENIGECLTTMTLLGASDDLCDFTAAQYAEKAILLHDFLNQLSVFMPVVDLVDPICPQGICDAKLEDVFLYRDEGHLSVEGSALLGARIDLMGIIQSRADTFYGVGE